MNKYLVGACVFLLFGIGCNGENTTLTPGSTDDPNFQIFMEEFGNIDDGTGVMVQSMFDMMDGVFNSNPDNPPNAAGEYQISLDYDAQSQEWVGTFQTTDSQTGAGLAVTDRVQFIQGGDPVQYPDPSLVEQVKSILSMDISGEGIESATGFQNITMAVDHQPEDVLLTLNGTGGWQATLSHTGTAGTCDVSMDFASTASGVKIWGAQIDGCPTAGSLSYSGRTDIQCTGESGDTSVTGTWSVSRTFAPSGNSTTRVIHDGNIWTVETPCN